MELNDIEDKVIAFLQKKYPVEPYISFNEFTLADRLKTNAFDLMKWNDFLLNEKNKLQKYQDDLDELACELYNFYRFECDKSLTKVEIEKYYIPSDTKYKTLMKKIRVQEIIVKYFEICAKAVDKVGWNMKNFIEQHKVM